MQSSFFSMLDNIRTKVEKSDIKDKRKQHLIKEVNSIKENYRDVEVPDKYKEIYEALIKKGRELLKQNNFNDTKNLETFLRYCSAAIYDFKDNLKPLNHFLRAFTITCLLFLALSPQYFSAILPLLFLLPIFLGIKGIKKRTYNGFVMSMSVIPVALMTSIVWIKNGILASTDFKAYISTIANSMNRSFEFARNLTLVFMFLSLIMLGTSIYTLAIGIKNRKLFV